MSGWRPDEMLVPALLAGSPTTMDDLDGCDRVWAVVVMTDDEEMTAEAIAERLGCSLRLVRTILADPSTVLMRMYRAEAETFERELDMVSGEVQRLASALATTEAERDRMQVQRDRLLQVALAERAGETHSCGCPVSRYNTYVSPSGKMGCREHRRLAVARHRARSKLSA
ncbi:hypothetical protein SEA_SERENDIPITOUS_73 [Mycobacterium phage Serendipitous]|uniref:Helix-turn-helix DNA binding domain protein n=1 Tax=Mycobacterium phage Serendipitous TaxID=2301619 RepID=A0A385UJX8_9CAUD|nr:hypothetical protein I5G64_gp73 [Mycobacterium phage Serendipitous]AYB70614.1 hypothetical protein SEA_SERENDIPITOUS_73 [Mycobacterium phage Serendipitous]